jgi:site-specific DNA recombinase
VPSSRGPWNTTQLRRVLSSATYAGTAHYDRIPVPVPPIVTPERHAAARAQLDNNRARLVGRPAIHAYLLKGLMVCGGCGYRYRGGPTSGRRRCYKHDQDRAATQRCRQRFYFAADAIEASVRDAIQTALSDPAVLRAGVARWEATRGATDVELRSRVAHVERQIAKVRQDERRLIGLVVGDAEQQDLVEGKLRELARQRGGLAEQLRQAQARVAQHAATSASAEGIERFCAQARRGLRGLRRLDATGWRALLVDAIDGIRVLPDRSLEIHGPVPVGRIGPGVKESV